MENSALSGLEVQTPDQVAEFFQLVCFTNEKQVDRKDQEGPRRTQKDPEGPERS